MDDAITPKQRTRQRILEEAATAMREHGADGIGVAALMKRAGLTHGGFYAHFENRDDLVAHAVERMFNDTRLVLEEHLNRDDPRRGLVSLIDAYLSEDALQGVNSGCPLPGLAGESRRMPQAARQQFADCIGAFQQALTRSLASIGSPEPETVAASALAEMVGAMTLARALDDDRAHQMLKAAKAQLKQRLGLV